MSTGNLLRKRIPAFVFGALALGLGIVSLIMGRKSIDDMQMATAGNFMAIVACLMGIWHLYN